MTAHDSPDDAELGSSPTLPAAPVEADLHLAATEAPQSGLSDAPTQASSKRGRSGLSTLSYHDGSPDRDGPPPSAVDAATATFVGRFAILRELGAGGMGQVYVAYDELLDRKLAVKVIGHKQHDPKANRRLLREAQAMAKIAHPNVVNIHEVGEFGDGIFVAMELIPGCTLQQWSEQPEHDWRDILAMYVQAGRGLAAAHQVGIVHRDFKPDNVLVGDDGRARVLDFGLARMLDTGERDATDKGDADGADADATESSASASASLSEKLTRVGSIMGTPIYMSPEQHAGQAADARSDQYNFCVSLYQALHELVPFDTRSMSALVQSKRSGKLDKPAHIPQELLSIHESVVRGLAVEPDERWPTMEELVDELESHIRETTTHAQRLNRVQYAILAAVGGIAAGGAIIANTLDGGLRHMSARTGVAVGLMMLTVMAVFKLTTRKYLESSLLARRILWLMMLSVGSITLHRTLGLVMAMPAVKLYAADFIILGGMAAVGGLAIHRWLWFLSLQMFGFAIIGSLEPDYVVYCMVIMASNLPVLAVVLWLRARAKQSAQALRTLLSRSRSREQMDDTQAG